MDLSDKQLITNYLSGNDDSLEFLIKKYLKHIYNYVYRNIGNSADAEDITQETFLKVWKNIKKFDREKNFKPWIFQIAKNTIIDFSRKKKLVSFSRFENSDGKNLLLEGLAGSAVHPSENIDDRGLLNNVIDALSLRDRAIFSYRYNSFNFSEIAKLLGEPVNTIKSRYRRAVSSLRKKFRR